MDIVHRYLYIYIHTVYKHTPDGYFVPKKRNAWIYPNSMDFSAWLIIKKQLFQLKNEPAKKKIFNGHMKKHLYKSDDLSMNHPICSIKKWPSLPSPPLQKTCHAIRSQRPRGHPTHPGGALRRFAPGTGGWAAAAARHKARYWLWIFVDI